MDATLIRKWHPEAPKTLPPGLVLSVIQAVDDSGDKAVELLYFSDFFHAVLWRWLEDDAPNSHVALVLRLCIYEVDNEHESDLLEEVVTLDRFEALLRRLLASSSRIDNFPFNSIVLTFFDRALTHRLHLVRTSLGPLFNIAIWANLDEKQLKVGDVAFPQLPLYPKYKSTLEKIGSDAFARLRQRWLHTLVSGFLEFVTLGQYEKLPHLAVGDTHAYAHAVLRLLITLVSQLPLRMHVATLLRQMNITAVDTLPHIALLDAYLNFPIDVFLGKEHAFDPNARFARFQAVLFEKYGLDDITKVATVWDTNATEVRLYLKKKPAKDLEGIAEALLLPKSKTLVSVITNHAVGSSFDAASLPRISQINELIVAEVYPGFTPTLAGQYLSVREYVFRHYLHAFTAFESSLFAHVTGVLSRLVITDPLTPKGIKGSSKYFAFVDSTSRTNGFTKITTTLSSSLWVAPSKGQWVVLLELQKPNKLSPHYRLLKYGVTQLRVAKVVRDDGAIDGGLERLSHVIRLPETLTDEEVEFWLKMVRGPAKVPKYLQGPLLGHSAASATDVPPLLVDCIEPSHWTGEPPLKKGPGHKAYVVSDQIQEYPYGEGRPPLTEQQATILRLAVGKGLTLVRRKPHCGTKTLVEAILRTLEANFPDERALVVVPSKWYLRKWVLEPKWVAWDEHLVSSRTQRLVNIQKTLLMEVDVLASELGLGAYGYADSAANVRVLYETHLQPLWKKFLQGITKENAADHFGAVFHHQLEFPGNPKGDLIAITRWFHHVEVVVHEIQALEPVVRFKHSPTIMKVLALYALAVVVPAEQVYKLGDLQKFDSVVMIDCEVAPPLFTKPKRVTVFHQNPTNLRGEPFSLVEPLARPVAPKDLRLSHQVVPLGCETPTNANKEEAQFAVALYKYLQKQGHAAQSISLVVRSPYQRLLIEDTLEENGVNPQNVLLEPLDGFHGANDIIIASLYEAGTSLHDGLVAKCSGRARRGLYVITCEAAPNVQLPTENLQSVGLSSIKTLTLQSLQQLST